MKSIGTIFIWLMLTKALPAEVTIKGIDYVKADSIASVLKGVNFVRGSQDAVLTLDQTRKLSIIDSSKFPGCPVPFAVGADGIRFPQDETRLSWEEMVVKLKAMVEAIKTSGHNKLYLLVHFDNDISGEAGHVILQDLCDCGIGGLLFQRAETREERALRLKQNRKPSSPK